MNFLGIRPPRAFLRNLFNDSEQQFLFNPQTIEETIEAKYERKQVLGLSHERLQYNNTGNNTIPIELFISTIAQDILGEGARSRPTLAERKAWLQSLVYPTSNTDFGLQGPPRVLFVWPNVLSLVGKIMKVSFLHRNFSNRTLETTVLVAKLDFEEDLEERILMEEVVELGSIRHDLESTELL